MACEALVRLVGVCWPFYGTYFGAPEFVCCSQESDFLSLDVSAIFVQLFIALSGLHSSSLWRNLIFLVASLQVTPNLGHHAPSTTVRYKVAVCVCLSVCWSKQMYCLSQREWRLNYLCRYLFM